MQMVTNIHRPISLRLPQRPYVSKKMILPIYSRRVKTSTSTQAFHNLGQQLVDTSYIVGKGLCLWVLFTSSMNWFMYKKSNEERESERDKK